MQMFSYHLVSDYVRGKQVIKHFVMTKSPNPFEES